MPFPGILGGFETHQKQFFEIFEAKEQKEKSEKVGKFLGNIGKNREKSDKGNFGGDIFSISTDFRYFADILAEISKILFPALSHMGGMIPWLILSHVGYDVIKRIMK